jgi:hypothetical protein
LRARWSALLVAATLQRVLGVGRRAQQPQAMAVQLGAVAHDEGGEDAFVGAADRLGRHADDAGERARERERPMLHRGLTASASPASGAAAYSVA